MRVVDSLAGVLEAAVEELDVGTSLKDDAELAGVEVDMGASVIVEEDPSIEPLVSSSQRCDHRVQEVYSPVEVAEAVDMGASVAVVEEVVTGESLIKDEFVAVADDVSIELDAGAVVAVAGTALTADWTTSLTMGTMETTGRGDGTGASRGAGAGARTAADPMLVGVCRRWRR